MLRWPLHDHDPLTVVHFSQRHQPMPFAPPRTAYENDTVRVEWRQMDDNRQPFYHRNTDVDEIQYQARGRRAVITQRGVVELEPGDLLRIPLGLAHTSIAHEETEHLRLLCHPELPQTGRTAKAATPYTAELLAALRHGDRL